MHQLKVEWIWIKNIIVILKNDQSEQMFNYEIQWLENNPIIKQFTTIHEKTRLILYQCSKCNYKINNNHQHFLNHIDHQHPDLLEDQIYIYIYVRYLLFQGLSFHMNIPFR